MHCQHLVSTFDVRLDPSDPLLGRFRRPTERLAHLLGMDPNIPRQATRTGHDHDSLEPVLTLSGGLVVAVGSRTRSRRSSPVAALTMRIWRSWTSRITLDAREDPDDRSPDTA